MLRSFLKKNYENSNFLLIYGENSYFLKKLENDIIDICFNKKNSDFNFDVFDSDNFNLAQIELSCSKSPFLASKRVILIKKIEEIEYKQLAELYKYIEKPRKKTLILLVSYSKFDKTTLNKKLYKDIPLNNRLELKMLGNHELTLFIEQFVIQFGKKIEKDAIPLFLTFVENDLFQIENELDKLINCAQNELITKDDVLKNTFSLKTNTIFELTDAIFENNLDKSITIFNKYFEKSSQGDILQFFTMLHNQLKKILLFKYYLTKNVPFKEASQLCSLNYFEEKRMESFKVPLKKLLSQYELLLATEPEVKFGGVVSFNALEKMMYKLLKV